MMDGDGEVISSYSHLHLLRIVSESMLITAPAQVISTVQVEISSVVMSDA